VRRRKLSARRPAPGSSISAVDVPSGTPEEEEVASISREAKLRLLLVPQVVPLSVELSWPNWLQPKVLEKVAVLL
jgi:hypothetical protein